ncbi:hypothetical protein OJ996_06880 [Luteolibacter sp. GHJ8]|uniref:Uncharacterized protein n=1 Tax=Luteolibacter rhizosphaerae TaxID=2989719 RepID=A0ABT3G0C7_9BACT|nr:hypothetical protein [Luteolibacter rhizosphaerae]
MALFGLFCLFDFGILPKGHAGSWATWGTVGTFILTLIGCCIFAAGVLTYDAPSDRRPILWAEMTVRFLLLQVILAPAVTCVILFPFIV